MNANKHMFVDVETISNKQLSVNKDNVTSFGALWGYEPTSDSQVPIGTILFTRSGGDIKIKWSYNKTYKIFNGLFS